MTMKKFTLFFITLMACSLIFAGCSSGSAAKETYESYEISTELLTPAAETGEARKALTEEDILGKYANDTYTAAIEEDEFGDITITILSDAENKQRSEWTMQGFLSNESLRINYTSAQKDVITVDASGNEMSRETEYTNGAGRLQFSDADHFEWQDSLDPAADNLFSRSR